MSEQSRLWSVAPAIAGAAAAVLSGLSAWQSNQNEGQIKLLQTQLTQTAEDRRFAQAIMDRYDQVITADTRDVQTRVDRLAGLTTLAAMIGDDRKAVREAILKTIYEQADRYQRSAQANAIGAAPAAVRALDRQVQDLEAIKQAAIVAAKPAAAVVTEDALAQAATTPPPAAAPAPAPAPAPAHGGWGALRVDIFYCTAGEGAADGLETANRFAGLRAADTKATGAWRVRPFAPQVNARPGFQVSGNIIRVSDRAEQAAAERMRAMVARETGVMFEVKAIRYPTPGYVSAFVCAGADPT